MNFVAADDSILILPLITTGISILVFGLFYALVYKITSNAYYAIVSGIRKTGRE